MKKNNQESSKGIVLSNISVVEADGEDLYVCSESSSVSDEELPALERKPLLIDKNRFFYIQKYKI